MGLLKQQMGMFSLITKAARFMNLAAFTLAMSLDNELFFSIVNRLTEQLKFPR